MFACCFVLTVVWWFGFNSVVSYLFFNVELYRLFHCLFVGLCACVCLFICFGFFVLVCYCFVVYSYLPVYDLRCGFCLRLWFVLVVLFTIAYNFVCFDCLVVTYVVLFGLVVVCFGLFLVENIVTSELISSYV